MNGIDSNMFHWMMKAILFMPALIKAFGEERVAVVVENGIIAPFNSEAEAIIEMTVRGYGQGTYLVERIEEPDSDQTVITPGFRVAL